MITRKELDEIALKVAAPYALRDIYTKEGWQEFGHYQLDSAKLKLFTHSLLTEVQKRLEVVGELHKAHCRDKTGEQQWCKEIIMYSPNNPHDLPEYRNQVTTLPLIEE